MNCHLSGIGIIHTGIDTNVTLILTVYGMHTFIHQTPQRPPPFLNTVLATTTFSLLTMRALSLLWYQSPIRGLTNDVLQLPRFLQP